MKTGLRLSLAIVAVIVGGCGLPSTAPDRSTAPLPAVSQTPSASPVVEAPGASIPAADLPELSRDIGWHVASWRPAGPTLLVDRILSAQNQVELIAVPLSGSAVPLAVFSGAIPDGYSWDARRDGSAIAVAIGGDAGMGIATLDLPTGRASWLVAPERELRIGKPFWSADGRHVFYGGARAGRDLGIVAVEVSSRRSTQVIPPLPPQPSLMGAGPHPATDVLFAGPEGVLAWSTGAFWATKVAELSSRLVPSGERDISVGPCTVVLAWHAQPRQALLRAMRCEGSGELLGLVRWEPTTGMTRLVEESTNVYGADWSPDGNRIVAAMSDAMLYQRDAMFLFTFDARPGAARTRVDGSTGARHVRWLLGGIAFVAEEEVRLIPAGGGAPRTLYRTEPDNVLGPLVVVGG